MRGQPYQPDEEAREELNIVEALSHSKRPAIQFGQIAGRSLIAFKEAWSFAFRGSFAYSIDTWLPSVIESTTVGAPSER